MVPGRRAHRRQPCGRPRRTVHDARPHRVDRTASTAIAIFAGGCFWSMEVPFDGLDGVVSTTAGYIGGKKVSPTYAEVSSGGTGHVEAVQIVYDPARISYQKLLVTFWHNVDPTNAHGQFCDFGDQYRSAVFARTPEQLMLARESKQFLERRGRFGAKLVTAIVDASTGVPFYPAEAAHQDYARQNPIQYRVYREACGRDAIRRKLWGPPGDAAR